MIEEQEKWLQFSAKKKPQEIRIMPMKLRKFSNQFEEQKNDDREDNE